MTFNDKFEYSRYPNNRLKKSREREREKLFRGAVYISRKKFSFLFGR